MNNTEKLTLIDQVLEILKNTEDTDERSQKIEDLGFQQTEKNKLSNAYLSGDGEIFIVDLFDFGQFMVFERTDFGNYE